MLTEYSFGIGLSISVLILSDFSFKGLCFQGTDPRLITITYIVVKLAQTALVREQSDFKH